jgi:hypothetical protein
VEEEEIREEVGEEENKEAMEEEENKGDSGRGRK